MLNSLESWYAYFSYNRSKTDNINWNEKDILTDIERRCIENSIAAFQFGEYSDGEGLLKSAERFAQDSGDDYLVPITKLFIAEEQTHSLLLKQFMTAHNIRLITHNWADTVFRGLRKNAGFEAAITVLITAEIIALIYYEALKTATNSDLLKCICDKILADEAAHVTYESEMITYIRDSKPDLMKQGAALLHQCLFLITIIVVYLCHKEVIKRGGYQFLGFWASCWSQFSKYFTKIFPVQTSESV